MYTIRLLISTLLTMIWFWVNGAMASASTVILPEPRGVYGVGTTNIELSDVTRRHLRNSDKRRWMATVFYPSHKAQALHPYMPGTLEDGFVCGVKVLAHAELNSPPIISEKFPVIIALPGRGGERQQETILYEALASHGYIIITMDQPYVANFVKLADDTKITLTFKDAWKLSRDRDYRYQYDNDVIHDAIQDIDYLLQNFDRFGDLARAFDRNKIILMGHSLGGNVAHIKGFSDKRIMAVVDIDSKITERKVFGRIGVPPNPDAKPVLFVRGNMQYQEDVGDQLTIISNSTIWSPDVQHSAFSDKAYFAAKIPHYGMRFFQSFYNWFFKRGPYFSSVDTSLGEYKVDQWFLEYPTRVILWLDKYAKNSLRR